MQFCFTIDFRAVAVTAHDLHFSVVIFRVESNEE